MSQVFVRKASGLRRDVTFLDAITLNLSNMSAGAALGDLGFTMVLLPSVSGVNLVYCSVLAWVLMIPMVIVYTMFTRRIARTGGDYVWVSRVFGGFVGGSLAFLGETVDLIPYMALITMSGVFAVGSVGVALGYLNFLPLALPGNLSGSNTVLQFILGALIIGTLIIVNIFKPKIGYKIVSVTAIIGIIALFVAVFTLVAGGTAGVQNYMTQLDASGANMTYTSVASSYSGPTFDLGSTVLMLPFFAIFIYPWINAGPAVASEIRGKNAIRWNVPISSLLTFVIATVAIASMYYAGGVPFINAALANPTLVYNYSFNFWTLAMGVSNNVGVSAFIGIGWIMWILAILAYLVIVTSRYMFAQAFDRFLPEKLAYVNPKYKSPIVAFLVELIVVVFLIGGAAFLYGTLVSLYGTIVAAMIYFFFIGAAAVRYALKNEKGQSKAILATAGALMSIVFAYIIYQFFAYTAIWGGNPFAYGFIAATWVFGAIIYLISKAYYSKRGIDITLTFKELPPAD